MLNRERTLTSYLPPEWCCKKGPPISVFVSRKLSRLFVRQRSTPLFDVPIKVETPERPLGTHLFTLLELQNEGAKFRWNVVSIPETLSNISPSSNKTPNAPVQGTSETVRSNPSPEDASAALDRIEIPP